MYSQNVMDVITPIAIAALAVVTATGNTTGVDLLGAASANPSATTNYEGQMAFMLNGINNSGTTPTLAAKLQDSDDNSSFADVVGGGFAGMTTTNVNGLQKVVVSRENLRRYVRIAFTAGGTSPNYTVGVTALAIKKNPA